MAYFCVEQVLIHYLDQWSPSSMTLYDLSRNDDVIKRKHFLRYWPFVRGIHRSQVNSPHKDQWRGALIFSLICAWINVFSKQSWGWWFEMPSRPLWRHCNKQPRQMVVSLSLWHIPTLRPMPYFRAQWNAKVGLYSYEGKASVIYRLTSKTNDHP